MSGKRRRRDGARGRRSYRHILTIAALVYIMLAVLAEIVLIVVAVRYYRNAAVYAMIIILPITAIVIASVMIYVSHMTNENIDRLTDAVNRVSTGDFDVRIETKNRSFSELYDNFNKMVAEISSVNILKDDYMSNLSHEIKTPIASINGFARLLESDTISDGERDEIVGLIVKETDRLSEISENVLLLSRVENQSITGEKKAYRLDSQIRDCVVSLEKFWSDKEITVNLNFGAVTYDGDEKLIMHIWTNLLTNAIKFTPKGGEITVDIAEFPDRISVTVADNGIGMTEEEAERIFDKFYRAEDGSASGSGLGLTICRRICEIVGGDIRVASTKGEGSAFTVDLR